VRGSWHYPQTYYEYDEEGLASWYGPGFHGKPKPYGEPFDQHALTAAHKTLPLPSIVKVTNLENGRSAIILIDDRGPFVYDGRIIDLSIASAKAVGSYTKGIARVHVQTLVSESKALAKHLARYGPSGRDPSGRTWRQVYDQDIAGKYNHDTFISSEPTKPANAQPTTDQKNVNTKKVPPQQNMTNFLKGIDGSTATQGSTVEKMTQAKPLQAVVKPIFIDPGHSFVQEKNMNAFVQKFPPNTPYKIERVLHPSGQKMYELKIGPYNSKEAAEKELLKIKKHGITSARIK
jgi:rare lipoprotein A